jgi:hypothetical protein
VNESPEASGVVCRELVDSAHVRSEEGGAAVGVANVKAPAVRRRVLDPGEVRVFIPGHRIRVTHAKRIAREPRFR